MIKEEMVNNARDDRQKRNNENNIGESNKNLINILFCQLLIFEIDNVVGFVT